MIELLYRALETKYGIAIHAVPVETVRQRLYKARSESSDPTLNHLQFRISPVKPEEEIWIVKAIPKTDAQP